MEGPPLSVASNQNGWIVDFENHQAQVLPLDEDGHGKRLSDLSCDELHAAIGGFQVEGRDVILVFKKLKTEPLPMDDSQNPQSIHSDLRQQRGAGLPSILPMWT